MATTPEAGVIEYLAHAAEQVAEIERVVLFGSRARGDARERSDYDVAVFAPAMSQQAWFEWATVVEEGFPSLAGIDLIRVDEQISDALRRRILAEARPIFSRREAAP